MNAAVATSLWRTLESYHAVVYYAPERSEHYTQLGLKGGWMGYFATRSAALGAVPPPVVTACFHNFSHSMVARALPDAWSYTTPEQAIEARLAVFDAAAHRLLGDGVDHPALAETAEIAVAAVRQCDPAGRPLHAAHVCVPIPAKPHLALFWAATALREYRGDGHVAALLAAGVDGCEAHVLMSALGLVPVDQRQLRGWSEADWHDGVRRLADRGWVTSEGVITDAGRRARAEIEQATDRLSSQPWERLGEPAASQLLSSMTPVVTRIITGGGLPYPNAIGVPPVPELAATQ